MEVEDSASSNWNPFGRRLSVSHEPSSSDAHTQTAPWPDQHTNDMPGSPPRRFAGDGFDYRRPAPTGPTEPAAVNIIDLTDDDAGPSGAPSQAQHPIRVARPPRFGREIIALDEPDGNDGGRAGAPESPEIQFVSSRRIEPSRRSSPILFEHNGQEEDEVEFLRERPLPESRRRRNMDVGLITSLLDAPGVRAHVPHLRQQIERRARVVNNHARQMERMEQLFESSRNRGTAFHIPPRRRGHLHIGFIAPTMNFTAVGFDLGLQFDEDIAADAPAAPPTYNAPDKAPDGFTRSPQEDGVLICPNCGDELCVGDSDQKRQVWIVKSCGHVCTTYLLLAVHFELTRLGLLR